jgi:hypothetical protein
MEIKFPKYSIRLNVLKPEVELTAKSESKGEVYAMWQRWNDEAANVYIGRRSMTGPDAGILQRLMKKYDSETLGVYFHTFWMRYADRLNTSVAPMVTFAAVLSQIEQEHQ